MYYTLDVRPPAHPMRRGLAGRHTIAGVPADTFFRVGAPLVTGLLSAGAIVYSVRGDHRTAAAVSMTALLLSSFVLAGQALIQEERA